MQNNGSALHSVWTWAFPLAAAVLLIAQHLHVAGGPAAAVLSTAVLVGSVFAAVHHAEVVAARIGEPFGSVVLAVAVTVIEVSLIISLMLSSPETASEIARDTVFAAFMIVLNGVVGLCLLFGGIRYYEQDFHTHASSGALGVLGTLATLVLILPNYTLAEPGPVFAPAQLAFVASVSVALYGLYLFVQTVRHRAYFLDISQDEIKTARPPARQVAISSVLLVIALAAVILLAEEMSPMIQAGVTHLGLPSAFVGVIIAAVVLMPEGLAAFRASRMNRLQTSLNLALGSALASIGLTIPTVAITSLLIGMPLTLGLEDEEMVLLILTLFASTLTLATGRTTVLQGGVHMVIFGVFLVIAAIP
ncbi:ionic transporter y4hA [Chelativorans sp. AA-79]|uniref:calcium:proton antiporter n=1 Tax=Chelativorans sp. AA-79 TaxID=3028735 RepID=UPI0023F952D0|nr:ionic transporter y4hA [Chelativorans sp. AA-79]WEX08872.1 ionic transporter y4hA [Chelativorans sp. AA-79]